MNTFARPSLRSHLLRLAVRWLIAPTVNGDAPVARRRQRLERIARLSRLPLPPCTRIESTTLRGVPADWVRNPRVGHPRTVLYFHGGAYALGSPQVYREFAAHLARAWQAAVALVDYRLAPEHPYPAAAKDALNAYQALLEQGIPAQTIVIAGDSAGGGLTLACALQARDGGLPLPAALVLFSPWVDLAVGGESARRMGRDDMLDAQRLRAAGADYLAGAPADTPLASPLFADLRGLPRTLTVVTDHEILYDDAVRLHDALIKSGSPSELRVYQGLWHVWPLFAGKLPEADAALADAAAFLARGAA
ncbi:Acetyl esterase/lipase [Fontimonas thermophila]|uniref:Acetyl esterase/lipase n=1 Tax=Fontimonas thermophila TaxID=1076937 RepID=A0A1I2KA27_9GAMM|nr:alpha/beta hydrolase [Fontimonas thermophila]SFF63159.1 Acetyl esterase/lipase [Fontimonas thermophila]